MSCSASPAWAALAAHYQDDMAQFESGPGVCQQPAAPGPAQPASAARVRRFVQKLLHHPDRILAAGLGDDCGWQARRDAMLAGEPINTTEGRAAMHWLLRMPRDGGQLRQHPVVQAWPQAQWTTWPPRTTP